MGDEINAKGQVLLSFIFTQFSTIYLFLDISITLSFNESLSISLLADYLPFLFMWEPTFQEKLRMIMMAPVRKCRRGASGPQGLDEPPIAKCG